MNNYHYAKLVDRNWGFLTAEEQERIRHARVLLAGCGLGSNIAVLGARTGFTRFILADGDNVEITNLNRQAFRLEHVGMNKAAATAELVREINPEAELEVVPRFITEKEAPALVAKADIIVNTVDPGPALFAINQAAREQNKIALFPLNIGFGGVVWAFSPDSATLEDLVGGDVAQESLFFRLVEKNIPHLPQVSSYAEKFSEAIGDIAQGVRPGPQLGIAASINASIIVTAMVRAVLGLPIKVAPQLLAIDAWGCSEIAKEETSEETNDS